jgi:hypothetical protein
VLADEQRRGRLSHNSAIFSGGVTLHLRAKSSLDRPCYVSQT